MRSNQDISPEIQVQPNGHQWEPEAAEEYYSATALTAPERAKTADGLFYQKKDLPRNFPHANRPQPMHDGPSWTEAKDDPRQSAGEIDALIWFGKWSWRLVAVVAVAVLLEVAFWQAWGAQ